MGLNIEELESIRKRLLSGEEERILDNDLMMKLRETQNSLCSAHGGKQIPVLISR
jgi:hypothetical protein